ncbi:hypothetical protein [Cellulosimicrobium cellulans]|uniref:hypothetical protein n=1 Tax=Cellulosimicrobium cellulans TaxID=1710 RepID=UPI001112D5BD|nr:hypothetical protein [Cellulosimicrobium cellulans]
MKFEIVLGIALVAVGLWHIVAPTTTRTMNEVVLFEKRDRAEPTARDITTVRLFGVLLLVAAVLLAGGMLFLQSVGRTGPEPTETNAPGSVSSLPAAGFSGPVDAAEPAPGPGPARR